MKKLHAELTYNKLNFNESEFSDIDNLIKKSEENYDLLISLSRKASSIYKVLGGYFELPVADGSVQYQITEIKGDQVFAKRCLGICLDDYADMILGDGNYMPLKTANDFVQRQRALDLMRELS